jgi:hypothetical protein
MNPPTKPNQRCRVIGGRMAFNGEGQGPNQGKEVITAFMHADKAGIEQENVWRCRAASGHVLQTYYGAGGEADFLECWLEVVEPDAAPPVAATTERDVTA